MLRVRVASSMWKFIGCSLVSSHGYIIETCALPTIEADRDTEILH